jgi:two-component system alkaline phosphatase synthesis response regulator PhoP
LARVRALLRRVARAEAPTEMLHAGPVTLDMARHQAQCAGAFLDLTPTEFELLHLLIVNPGQTLDRETLLNKVWGYDWYGNTRVVDTHIQHLRRKLRQHHPDEDLILTVRGTGYRFAA